MPKSFDKRVYYAWLSSSELDGDRLAALLACREEPEEIFDDFVSGRNIYSDLIPPGNLAHLRKNADIETLERYGRILHEYSISVISYLDPIFPDVLRQVKPIPAILFCRGSFECFKSRMIGMVGSRAASYNGIKAARKLSSDLSRHGITIVSGLANGIDTASHQGCLEGGSPTVAVMGCGLNTVYPSCNKGLADEILNHGGLMISEFAPESRPVGWHFPYRNRLISGLSDALVLMEAKIRSGSMTTVQHALDQGKDVFVYPGDPSSPLYEGNHQLLREGAYYFTKAEDILEDLGWLDNPFDVRQNSDCNSDSKLTDSSEILVFEALGRGRLSFEELIAVTSLESSTLLSTLTILQVKGFIEALPGKIYQRKS